MHVPADQGQYVRRSAHHLRAVHRVSARDDHRLHRHRSTGFWTWLNTYIFDTKSAFYIVCYFLLIIGFSYFYATIQFNPIEIANNLKKNGGFIPGFRPGKPTSDFILKVINKITLFGALYLAIVAILPIIVGIITGNIYPRMGGTSVIIVVGVALETVKSWRLRC